MITHYFFFPQAAVYKHSFPLLLFKGVIYFSFMLTFVKHKVTEQPWSCWQASRSQAEAAEKEACVYMPLTNTIICVRVINCLVYFSNSLRSRTHSIIQLPGSWCHTHPSMERFNPWGCLCVGVCTILTSTQRQQFIFKDVLCVCPFIHQVQFCYHTNSAHTCRNYKQ